MLNKTTGLLSAAMLGAALLGAAIPAAFAAQEPAHVADTAKGKALVDAKGMTLYVFAKDADGKSACNGKCAANWPPLMVVSATDTPAGWSVVVREDGAKQWAYKGKPLYTWVKDQKPGDTTGDGFLDGAWSIARP